MTNIELTADTRWISYNIILEKVCMIELYRNDANENLQIKNVNVNLILSTLSFCSHLQIYSKL